MGSPGMIPERGPAVEAIRRQLDKILASPAFVSSERASRLLRFIVEQALRGRDANEYAIGVDVFDKDEAFDPRIDPIVRVQMRRLRSKLKEYYENQGAVDAVEICLPLRKYIPVIRARSASSGSNTQTAPISTIAVLPFQSLSPDKEDEYFSEGLTEELIHAIAGLNELRIIAIRDMNMIQSGGVTLRQIVHQHNIRGVLEGRVRRSGRNLRVSVHLTDATDGSLIWSQMYERQVEDVFVIQEEIARAIAQALRIRTGARAEQRLVRLGTNDLQAYHLYLKARHYCNERTRPGLEKCVEYMQRAVNQDGEYACARAGLSEAFTLMALYGDFAPAEVMPKAKAAGIAALERDPDSVDANTSLGIVAALYDWDFQSAQRHFTRAIESSWRSAQPHLWYGMSCLLPLGRTDDGLTYLRTAVEYDPLSVSIATDLAYALYTAGKCDEALQLLLDTLELEPDFYLAHWVVGLIYEQMARPDRAIASLESARDHSANAPFVLAALGHAYGVFERAREAAAVLDHLERESRERYIPGLDIALVQIGLGQRDEALDSLEQAYESRCTWLTMLGIDPRTGVLHSEPRFRALLEKMKVMQ